MAGLHGALTQKVKRRLEHMRNNIAYIRQYANGKERLIIDAVQSAPLNANSTVIAKQLGLAPSGVNYVLRKYETYYADNRAHIINPPVEPEKESDGTYEIKTDMMGKEWVAYAEVKELIHKPAIVIKNIDPIQVRITNVSHIKNTARDIVTISMYLNNQDGVTLEDLFELLVVGDTVGITI